MAMIRTLGFTLLSGALLAGGAGAPSGGAAGSRDVVLWAWERPEDLRFLGGRRDVGVAFLSETLTLDGPEIHASPRRQSLRVADTTPLEAVIRIEWVRGRPFVNTPGLRADIVRHFVAAAALPRVQGVQVDFDVPVSARPLYRETLQEIRAALPLTTRFSMTALASWCTTGTDWLDTLAPFVDEVVPMVFSMGPDAQQVWGALDLLGGFASPVCSQSIGVAVGERAPRTVPARKVYVFDKHPWTRADFEASMLRLAGPGGRGE